MNTPTDIQDCTEPSGNDPAPEPFGNAHLLMIMLAGQCPWCGEEIEA